MDWFGFGLAGGRLGGLFGRLVWFGFFLIEFIETQQGQEYF